MMQFGGGMKSGGVGSPAPWMQRAMTFQQGRRPGFVNRPGANQPGTSQPQPGVFRPGGPGGPVGPIRPWQPQQPQQQGQRPGGGQPQGQGNLVAPNVGQGHPLFGQQFRQPVFTPPQQRPQVGPQPGSGLNMWQLLQQMRNGQNSSGSFGPSFGLVNGQPNPILNYFDVMQGQQPQMPMMPQFPGMAPPNVGIKDGMPHPTAFGFGGF